MRASRFGGIVRGLVIGVASLVLAACSSTSGVTTTTDTAPSEAPGTTTTPTTATTTTAAAAGRFTMQDLRSAIIADGDPWIAPITGVESVDLTLDIIWAADDFPAERQAYVDAGFVGGLGAIFPEGSRVLISVAHLFETSAGADAALTVLEGSVHDAELMAEITGLPPGSLVDVEDLPVGFGDRAIGVRLTGAQFQVVGVVWITDNLLQFVRTGMSLDESSTAIFDVVAALVERTG